MAELVKAADNPLGQRRERGPAPRTAACTRLHQLAAEAGFHLVDFLPRDAVRHIHLGRARANGACAADSFQRAWKFRLGFATSAEINKEHWTRVKALNQRIANELDVEYDSLRPVADFVGRITEEISNFLDHPVHWTRTPKDDTEAQEAIAPIRQAVFRELHSLAVARLLKQHLTDWRRGNDHKGKGSATRRAVDIRGIYELAAPVPGTVNSEPALDFMKAVRDIVRAAIEEQGGEMKSL